MDRNKARELQKEALSKIDISKYLDKIEENAKLGASAVVCIRVGFFIDEALRLRGFEVKNYPSKDIQNQIIIRWAD
jgi:hypothetical protein